LNANINELHNNLQKETFAKNKVSYYSLKLIEILQINKKFYENSN